MKKNGKRIPVESLVPIFIRGIISLFELLHRVEKQSEIRTLSKNPIDVNHGERTRTETEF